MADAKKYLDLEGLATYDGKIKDYVNEKESTLNTKITAEKNRAESVEGTLTNLTTDVKDNLVVAINEVDANANAAAAAAQAAQNAADAAQKDVDALEGLVGTLPESTTETTVTDYIGKVATDLIALNNSLAAVAKSGAAVDVSIADGDNKINATTVEGALAELADAISSAKTAGIVTCVKDTEAEGVAARYTFSQGGTPIANAVIDIPKDMVVKSGEVVTNPEGKPAGTYLVLTLANATEDKIYIDVTTLIEYVTGGETAEIAVSVDPITHVVTSTVKKIDASKIIYKADPEKDTEVSVAAALNDIYAQIGEGGSVAGQISAAIAGLDATVKQEGTGANGTGLTLQVIETDGTLTAVAGSINTITGDDINILFNTTTVEG